VAILIVKPATRILKKVFQVSRSAFLTGLLVALCLIPESILADGMMFKRYADRWDYYDETSQQAFINYENGLQKMIISVGFDAQHGNDTVWLFPVPSDPNKVAIDVIRNLPYLGGQEISKKAKYEIDEIKDYLRWTQLILPFFIKSKGFAVTAGEPEHGGFENDVSVFEHLEKEGITTEIITARTASGLYDYLRSKGLKVESGAIPVLDQYIGRDYSFVVSWISFPDQFISAEDDRDNKRIDSSRQRGVFVTFPTREIYFPMLPTSVYGSKIVPATIRIYGHVSPKISELLKSYTKVEYYIDHDAFLWRSPEERKGLEVFYNGPSENIKYTKIEIKAPSKFLTEDLWMSSNPPRRTEYVSFVATHAIFIGILLLILISFVTGIFAGWIAFKDLRKSKLKLGLIGLSNCATIIGVLMATSLARTKAKAKDDEALLTAIRQKGYLWRRRVATILFYAAVPFLIPDLLCLIIIYDIAKGIMKDGLRSTLSLEGSDLSILLNLA